MKYRKTVTALGGSLALCCTIAACSSGPTASSNAPLSDADIPSFTFAISAAPPSFDETNSNLPSATDQVMSSVTEPLEYLSSDGKYTLGLAAKVTQPDSNTIVYELRPEITFSDGQPLTAEDVAWSITHAATPPAQTASNLSGAFVGATATGPLEVTVKLKNPRPNARAFISQFLIQQKKFAEAHKADLGTDKAIPVGTGSYTVTTTSSSAITLTRREDYWGEKPKIKQLTYQIVSDDNSAQLAMRSGSVNAATVADPKTIGQWRAIPGATVYSAPSPAENLIGMDVSKAPFDDIHVRKAIAHATDVQGLIKAAWGGEATQLKALLPPANLAGVAGGTQPAEDFVNSLPQYAFDLEKAKAELAQSSHPNGFSTTIEYIDSSPATKLLALSLQQNLKQIGITVDLKSVTLTAWGGEFYQHQLTGLMLAFDFTATVPDPTSLMGALVGQKNIGPQRLNIANWTTPEVEQALPVVNSPGPNAERWAAAKTLLSQIADQVPYIPLAAQNSVTTVGNGYASSTGGMDYRELQNGLWLRHVRARS